MLTADKCKAIELLIEDKISRVEVAKTFGIDRKTLYNWIGNNEFKTEWSKRLQEIQTYGANRIKSRLADHIDNILLLAKNADSEKIVLDTNLYQIDKVMGKNTSKLQVSDSREEAPE